MKTKITLNRHASPMTLSCLLLCGLFGVAFQIDTNAQGRGGGRGGTASASSAVNTRVVAVADENSNSLVVAAPDTILPMIMELIAKLDQPVSDITELRVFRLSNADPVETADLLASLFPDETRSGSNNNSNQPQVRFGGFGGRGGGQGANSAANSSERAKKQGRVLAVPDQRTSSLVVSAASELMPQIAGMIEQLDANPAKKQKVFVYSLDNADPQQVAPILQEMFQRNGVTTGNNANQNSALSTRIQSNNQAISTGAANNQGFGGGASRGTGIGGGQQIR